MKKLLYVASTYSHIKNFHLPYIKSLKEKYEVDILSNGKESDFNIPFKKKLFSFINLLLIFKIRRIIKNNKYSAIILNTSLAAFLTRLTLPKRRRPFVINIVHGYLFDENTNRLKRSLLLMCEKINKRKTDVNLTMNNYDYEISRRYKLAKKTYFIYGMGVEKLKENEHNPYDKCKFNLLYVGELSDRKNQIFIIKAMKYLIQYIPSIHVTFIGGGNNLLKYQQYCKRHGLDEYISFTGYIDNPSNYYKYCDVYVSSSLSEGLPFNIINAMQFNKTIIYSNVKGHKDIYSVDSCGILYSGEQDFIDKVINAYENHLCANGVKTFERYSFDEVFNENISLLNELLENNV